MTIVNHNISEKEIEEYRGQLLSWYDSHRRDIPWRMPQGVKPDPYRVWLSEIMCQQTTVQAVKAYYEKFLGLWPTIHDLANAPEQEIMAAWAGLGYYARARNLHKCAKIVSGELNGIFPETQDALKKLPGIGEYTSAAITAIAFNKPAVVVDGNVERVLSRFFTIKEPLPKSKPLIKTVAAAFYNISEDRPGDLAQAFMDLGAGICIPKNPRCILCPVQDGCLARKQGIQAELPAKETQKARPKKYGYVYWVERNGELLFHKREAKGLLGGMTGLPTTEWIKKIGDLKHLSGFEKDAQLQKAKAHHTFTHFDLELRLYKLSATQSFKTPEAHFWAKPEDTEESLPTVFKKPFKLFSSKTQS